MRVHLRFSEKDRDLCRWRHSIKKRMFTYYVSQILLSEIKCEIAYLPTALSMSANADPCEIYMNFTDPQIVEFLQTFQEFRRNATLKRIIRKHLHAQSMQTEKIVVYQSNTEAPKRKEKKAKGSNKVATQPDRSLKKEPKKEIIESEEDRAAILALIAMGGE